MIYHEVHIWIKKIVILTFWHFELSLWSNLSLYFHKTICQSFYLSLNLLCVISSLFVFVFQKLFSVFVSLFQHFLNLFFICALSVTK
jgi:hypothetical protein